MSDWIISIEWDDQNGRRHRIEVLYGNCAKPQRERVVKEWLSLDERNNVVVSIVRADA